jgi:hypothetical protein
MSSAGGPRQDRFDYSIPIITQDEFYKTNFLKCYDQTERHPGKTPVINSLRTLENGTGKFAKIIESIEKESDESDVIRTYSSDFFVAHQKFYCYTNQQLCADNMETMSKLMPLIRRATRQINYHAPSSELVVYRGMTLNNSQKAFFTTGTVFRFPGFTSTSKSKDKAQLFGSNTLFEIRIYAGCLQVRDIASISYYPSEEEYLFSPYSLFEVTAKNDNLIVLKAIDNMSRAGMTNCNAIPTNN